MLFMYILHFEEFIRGDALKRKELAKPILHQTLTFLKPHDPHCSLTVEWRLGKPRNQASCVPT